MCLFNHKTIVPVYAKCKGFAFIAIIFLSLPLLIISFWDTSLKLSQITLECLIFDEPINIQLVLVFVRIFYTSVLYQVLYTLTSVDETLDMPFKNGDLTHQIRLYHLGLGICL